MNNQTERQFYIALLSLMENGQFENLFRAYFELESMADWDGIAELSATISLLGTKYLEDENGVKNYVKERIKQLER